MIEKIGHYSLTNPATVYDEEALTALELAGRTAAKTNECIEAVNGIPQRVSETVQEHIDAGEFDSQIRHYTSAVTRQIATYESQMQQQVEETQEAVTSALEATQAELTAVVQGETHQLEQRLNNLIKADGATGDNSELLDIRTGSDGTTYANAGEAVRKQVLGLHPFFTLFGYRLEIDTTTKTAKFIGTADGRVNMGTPTREKTYVIGIYPTPLEVNFDFDMSIGLWLDVTEKPNVRFHATSIRTNQYAPNANDILLCTIYQNKFVCPVSLAPGDIYVNGRSLMPVYMGQRGGGYSGLMVPYNPITVDYVDKTITVPAGYYSVPFLESGVHQIDADIVTPFSYYSVVQYVLFNHPAKTVHVQPRTYVIKEDEILLGTLFAGRFIPAEVPHDCVTYGAKGAALGTGHTYMADFFAPMHSATPEKPFKIVLAGDSITYGAHGTGAASNTNEVVLTTSSRTYYRNTAGYCWANLFRDYIQSNFNAVVVNNGCSGTDSGTWNTYKSTLIPADADLVIMTIGTNNRDNGKTKAECLETYYTEMRAIIDYCHSINVPVLLCAPMPAGANNEDLATKNYPVHLYDICGVVQRLASEYDMDYANIYNEMFYYCLDNNVDINMLLDDQLHPNDAGYRVLYYRYMKAFGLNPHYNHVK